jgi:hypothetical protein
VTSYAPNYSARLRVKYKAAHGIHTQTWRFPDYGTLGIGLAAAVAAVEAIWSHLTPVLFDDTACLACTYAITDSNIFLPTDPISISGTVAISGTFPPIKADAVSLVGRTSTGQPAKEFFYGIDKTTLETGPGSDYRVNPGESVEIDDTIAEANGFLIPLALCGSDRTGITWYPYANLKPNDYWVKRLRQGA